MSAGLHPAGLLLILMFLPHYYYYNLLFSHQLSEAVIKATELKFAQDV